MVSLVTHDLQFILAQIKIAEQNATTVDGDGNLVAGTPLIDLVEDPHLPYGLRTVDGTFNNIVPGRELWGSADQPMIRLTPAYWRSADLSLDMDGPGPAQGGVPTSYEQTSGFVFDADPRLISNLISDQTANNPAAIVAAGGDLVFDIDGETIIIPNVSPDEGLTAPFNSWMTLFGQFFDHGLDLVSKGGSGTVIVPLASDDPLYVPGSPTNFMVLTRATNQPGPDGILGTADDIREHANTTTPWIDQNQTYTSHPSHQVFLREYALNADGKPVATGHLLDSANGGPATWAETKAQAHTMLGINLTDAHVTNVPLLLTDEYGQFLRGPNGYAVLVTASGLLEGDPTANGGLGVNIPSDTLRTGHAFLDDIAHNAAPVIIGGVLQPDADTDIGNAVPVNAQGNNLQYDNELLDAHYITGDGRGNENIGLTAVHHVFHSEHNRLVEHTKATILESGDLTFLNEWLVNKLVTLPGSQAEIDSLVWDGERLFQAGRFVTEMQYQHLVFEEFARKVQPAVDVFVFNQITDIDPGIVAEFAHVVYRFGHSMLTETVARTNSDGSSDDIGLIDAFLNPLEFAPNGMSAEEGAGAIIRGMTRQVGNEIDEFVTDALRNNLLGLPLDLATLNIVRARETGMATLQQARETFYEQSGSQWLKPYTSWVDFAQNIKNPASVINFIAAYGTHATIVNAVTAADKREAATLLVLGSQTIDPDGIPNSGDETTIAAPADRVDFLTATGAYAGGALGGLNDVDFWIGGLAEDIMPFGGMLGSTFMYVFEAQLENLQNADRLYYLSRTQGLNLLNELEANTFASLVMLNTNLGDANQPHLPGDLFANVDFIIEMDTARQFIADPLHTDPVLAALFPKVDRRDIDGDGDADYLRFDGPEHVVLGGTDEADTIIGDEGDDTLWGDDGDDTLDGGAGVNHLHGGDGDDLILDGGDISFMHGEDGDDIISAGRGVGELIFAGAGSDFVIVGDDGKEAFGGTGDDFILGGSGIDFLLGNEGNDWIEGGDGFDTIAGDNSELFFNSTIIGHDVMFSGPNEQDFDAESGDDIMVQGESVIRNEGMLGFDWVTHKGSRLSADIDLGRPIFTTDALDILRNRYDRVEAASGWNLDDVIVGDDRGGGDLDVGDTLGQNETTLFGHELLQENMDIIAGLRDLIANAPAASFNADLAFIGGNVLLGGGGDDIIEGQGADDIIDGDKWLNVRLSVRAQADHSVELFSVDSLTQIQTRLLSREILPSQLEIVREIIDGNVAGDIDTASFRDLFETYQVVVDRNGTANDFSDDIVTVSHVAPTLALLDDGVDVLTHIERLRFSDGGGGFVEFALDEPNQAAQGAPVIDDLTPTESFILGANTFDIFDPNGFTTFAFQWQSSANGATWTDIAGATDITFTPTQAEVGRVLRVEVSFVDLAFYLETVVSAVTGVVGDLIDGTAANETFTGTAGDDVINGAGGNDILFGLAGADTLNGDAGDDQLQGDVGANILNGGAGNDILVGRGDADIMTGGLGDDMYQVENAGDIIIELANEGADIVRSTITYTLGANLENLSLLGAAAINGSGNALNNVIIGNAAANTLSGGGGDDALSGGGGADTMIGGQGNDIYTVSNAGVTIVEAANQGTDTIRTRVTLTLANNVENLELMGAADIGATGNGLANAMSGNSGANAISGGAGNDTIAGGLGADTLLGEDGADTLIGGAGADILQGGADVDTITGDAGDDIINGGTGADIINGGVGNDTIAGGDGADRITGGAGNDTMNGNAGNDVFVFQNGFGADTILGFDANPANGGQDLLDISGLGVTAANFAARVSINAIPGGDTLITIGANSILLDNVASNVVTAQDFILG